VIKNLQWLDEFEPFGYRAVKRGSSRHWKVYGPAGDLVTTISATPSDNRGWLNARADLRRHQRHREAAMRKISTSTRPESPTQVRQWEKTKSRYIHAGLCERCAAQAAWAHQPGAGGWNAIRPPCSVCAEVMTAAFPYPTTNPLWRSVLRKRSRPGKTPVKTPSAAKSGGQRVPGHRHSK
jgi:hypothetical protein